MFRPHRILAAIITSSAIGLCGPSFLSNPAFAQQKIQERVDPNVIQYTLGNGLKVALAPSKTAQTVALVTQYRVGSADEAPGRSGFAHLFEHLMFEGTKSVPDFDKVVSGVGGQNNAFTEQDATTYYMTGPKEALPLFLRLDADRMANLANAVSEEDLANQRAVVLNEMRQNILDQPGGAARTQNEVAIYPAGHPYAHAPIGSIADLTAAKLDDVIAFHRIHYVPSNANIAITGNFDVQAAKLWIDQTFGLVPNAQSLPSPQAPEFKANTARQNFIDAVTTPIVTLQWQGPRGFSKETVINGMLAGALSVGKDAFDNQLVVEQGLASGVDVAWVDGELGGTFRVYAAAAQGVSAEKLEAAMRTTLDGIAQKGFTEDTLKIVRTDMETGYSSIPNNPLGFAMTLVESLSNGDARTWAGELDFANAVTAKEVTDALRSFTGSAAQVSIVNPGPRNTNYPPAIANSTGASAATAITLRDEVVIPEIALEASAGIVFPKSETRKLASGSTLISYKIEDPAKVGISMVTKGGTLDGEVGLVDLAMAVGSRGAGDLSLADKDVRYRENGVTIYGGAGRHYSQIVGSAPVKNFETLASQMAEAVLRPRFDAKEWTATIDQSVTGLEAAKKSPEYQASLKLRNALYPAGSAILREPDVNALKALKSEAANKLFKERMRPDQTIFHVASQLPIEQIVATLDKAFLSWLPNGDTVDYALYNQPVAKELRLEAQIDGATQTTILAALPAPDEGTPESVAFGMAVQALGGDAGSRLNKVLREEKGWSYGIGASVSGDKARNNSLLVVSTTVQADHTEDSIKEIRKILAELSDKPITQDEFETARRTIKSQFLSAFDSAPGMASFAGSLFSQGYELADVQSYLKEIETVTLEQVNAQAKQIAQSPVALSIAGDKALMK